jgi:hypothetical protein
LDGGGGGFFKQLNSLAAPSRAGSPERCWQLQVRHDPCTAMVVDTTPKVFKSGSLVLIRVRGWAGVIPASSMELATPPYCYDSRRRHTLGKFLALFLSY